MHTQSGTLQNTGPLLLYITNIIYIPWFMVRIRPLYCRASYGLLYANVCQLRTAVLFQYTCMSWDTFAGIMGSNAMQHISKGQIFTVTGKYSPYPFCDSFYFDFQVSWRKFLWNVAQQAHTSPLLATYSLVIRKNWGFFGRFFGVLVVTFEWCTFYVTEISI